MQYEAQEYEPQGVERFHADIEWKKTDAKLYELDKRLLFVAADGEKIIGVIESNRPGHVNMVFVDGAYHRQGVATAMMVQMLHALKLRGSDKITLNSSPYGLPFYLRFGFAQTDSEQRKDGFIFTPMLYEII